MDRYTPKGNTVAEQIRDLACEATATGHYTVAKIAGVDLGAWPGDDVQSLAEAHELRKSDEWDEGGSLGNDMRYARVLDDPETERLIDAAAGVQRTRR